MLQIHESLHCWKCNIGKFETTQFLFGIQHFYCVQFLWDFTEDHHIACQSGWPECGGHFIHHLSGNLWLWVAANIWRTRRWIEEYEIDVINGPGLCSDPPRDRSLKVQCWNKWRVWNWKVCQCHLLLLCNISLFICGRSGTKIRMVFFVVCVDTCLLWLRTLWCYQQNNIG